MWVEDSHPPEFQDAEWQERFGANGGSHNPSAGRSGKLVRDFCDLSDSTSPISANWDAPVPKVRYLIWPGLLLLRRGCEVIDGIGLLNIQMAQLWKIGGSNCQRLKSQLWYVWRIVSSCRTNRPCSFSSNWWRQVRCRFKGEKAGLRCLARLKGTGERTMKRIAANLFNKTLNDVKRVRGR